MQRSRHSSSPMKGSIALAVFLWPLATGGSVVTDPETWHLLKRRTHTVWLKTSPEALWKRVLKLGDTRPMSNRASAMAELRSIIAQRAPLYSEAAQTIGAPWALYTKIL